MKWARVNYEVFHFIFAGAGGTGPDTVLEAERCYGIMSIMSITKIFSYNRPLHKIVDLGSIVIVSKVI